MADFILTLLKASLSASVVLFPVLILRAIFKKASKRYLVLLWIPVLLRLLMPISVKTDFSLMPRNLPTNDAVFEESTVVDAPNYITVDIPETTDSKVTEIRPETRAFDLPTALFAVWVVGFSAMLIYSAVSYFVLKHRVRFSVPFSDAERSIRLCDGISTPFILGIIKPKIYLPSGLESDIAMCVTEHEKAHIKRLDHIIKPLAFLLLSVHFFNPFMWLSYVLLCRDIELACDEKVVNVMENDGRKKYAEALVFCGVERKRISACPLAFGEVGVKERVKNVMSFRRPIVILSFVLVIALILVGVFFLTDPKEETEKDFGDLAVISTGSDYEGVGKVYFEVTNSTIGKEDNKLYVKLVNGTDTGLEHGTPYSVYRMEDEKKSDCDTVENRYYNMPLLFVFPDRYEEIAYSMDGYDLTKEGTYRIEQKFKLQKDKEHEYKKNVEYTAYIEFSLSGERELIGAEKFIIDPEPEKPIYIEKFYSHFLRVDGTGDGYNTVWKYAANRMSPISSIQFLPLVVINDREDLASFTEGTKEHFGYDRYLKEYYGIIEKYDEKYFEENSLFITYVAEGSGSVSHYVPRIYRENGYVRVFVSKLVPEVGTMDMAGWFGFVEVEKSDISDIVEFDAVSSATAMYYEFHYPVEPEPAYINLLTDGTYHFYYSAYSSDYIVGEYEWSWSDDDDCEILILHRDDKKGKYVFKRNEDKDLVFDAKNSFPIQEFKYSLASSPTPAVYDGAVFERKA